jgi:hypothetical protein
LSVQSPVAEFKRNVNAAWSPGVVSAGQIHEGQQAARRHFGARQAPSAIFCNRSTLEYDTMKNALIALVIGFAAVAAHAQAGTAVKEAGKATAETAKQGVENAKAATSSQPEKAVHQVKAKVHKAKAKHAASASKAAAKEAVK